MRASYQMDGDSDACMIEPEPQNGIENTGSSGHQAGGMLTGSGCMDVDDNAESVKGAHQEPRPEPNALRTEKI